MTMKIIVGTDGSEQASRAIKWCATYAPALDAEVVVVHAIGARYVYRPASGYYEASSPLSSDDEAALQDRITNDWCVALANANVPFRVVLIDQGPARAIIEAAKTEQADLVVVGRRGRGGFAELVLGGTSHALTQHLDRPLLIIP
jgi:nucleotide-binding universal stress UspA family protein